MRVAAAAALLVLLSACAQGPDEPGQYLTRLARVLDRPVPQIELRPQVPYPARRVLRLPFSEASLDWLEFARLHECDMGDLVGYRNSGLGRVMGSLERYRYERSWSQVAAQCAGNLAAEQEGSTQALLARLREQKAQDLQAAWWNLVFAGPELQRWLRLRGPATDAPAADRLPSPAAALLAVRQFAPVAAAASVAGPDAVAESAGGSLATLGTHLEGLAGAAGGGSAFERWAQVATLLRRATALVDGASVRLCRNGQQTPAAARLKNVFRKFYVAELQGELAGAVNADRPWVEQLNAIVANSPRPLPGAFAQWHDATISLTNERSLWLATRQAFRDHSQAWQTFAAGCDLNLFDAG